MFDLSISGVRERLAADLIEGVGCELDHAEGIDAALCLGTALDQADACDVVGEELADPGGTDALIGVQGVVRLVLARDRDDRAGRALDHAVRSPASGRAAGSFQWRHRARPRRRAVSYTHLTLPTIYSV